MRSLIFSELNLFLTLFIVFFAYNSNAQCSSCTVTNPTASNYTFASGSTVCITVDKTFSSVNFQNNSKICVAPGVTVIIQNNISTNNGDEIEFEIGGTLQFNQVPQINANITANIQSTGVLRAGTIGNNNFTINGSGSNEIINNGLVEVGVLQFQNSSATNVIENFNIFEIDSNINISGNTTFRNFGTINVGASFNNSQQGTYINCGTFTAASGFNLSGGNVINTGVFNVLSGSLDLPTGSQLNNYGSMIIDASVNNTGSTSIIYNEGFIQMNSTYQGAGWLRGPDSSSKKGFFEVDGGLNTNGANVGPNLDFKRNTGTSSQSSIFNSSITYVDSNANPVTQTVSNVTYDCRASSSCGAPFIDSGVSCANTDGSFSDLAISITVDDSFPVVGDNVTFTITATNNGIGNNTNIEVQSLLPAGYVFVSSNTSFGSYNSTSGVWDIILLNNGDSETLTLTATVNDEINLSYTSTITGDVGDLDLSNNDVDISLSALDTDNDLVNDLIDVDADNDGILNSTEELGYKVGSNNCPDSTIIIDDNSANGPAPEVGVAGEVGAIYRWSGAVQPEGYDVLIEITDKTSNADLIAIDVDNANPFRADAWRPQIGHPFSGPTEAWVEFEIRFVETGTGGAPTNPAQILRDLNRNGFLASDIDGNCTENETALFYDIDSYFLSDNTDLTVTETSSGSGDYRTASPTGGGNASADENVGVFAFYNSPRSTYALRLGTTRGSGCSNDRQALVSFGVCVPDDFFTNPSVTFVNALDTDGDGIPNHLDLDSDNDGITDIVEAGGVDTNNDGVVDGTFTDTDGDGWDNTFDSDNGGTALTDINSDGVGQSNRVVLDSDGDGCSDTNEYYENGNEDGNADGTDNLEYGTGVPSVDANGLVIAASYDGTTTGLSEARDDTVSDACVFIQVTDGNWDNFSNWRERAIPTFNNDAIIDDGITSTVSSNQEVRSLTTNSGSRVIISNGNTVNIKENLTNNGDFDGEGKVVFDGSVAQNIFGDGTDAGTFTNIELNNSSGLTLRDSIIITSSLNVENGNFISDGLATFFCDFSGANPKTAMIDDLTNGNIIGDVTTQQCFPGRRAFRLVTSTVTTTGPIREYWQEDATAWNDNPVPNYGTHITGLGVENGTPTNDGLNGFDWQPSGNPSLFVFDNSTTTWSPISNTDVNTLLAGEPYRIMIRGSRDVNIQFNASPSSNTRLRGTGLITKGPVTYNDAGFGNQLDDVILIGNPFQAIVDLQQTLARSSNIRPFVQVYDPKLGGVENDGFLGGRGAFINVNINTNANSNPDSDANKFLQAYQAVFFLADGNGAPSIVFAEADKRIQEDQTQIFSIENPKIKLRLYDQESYNVGGTSRDGLVIEFSDQYNNAYNLDDAPKMENVDENLARLVGADLSSYETRALPEVGESLALFLNKYRRTEYVFTVDVSNFDSNIEVALVDQYTGESHILSHDQNNEIFFTVNSNVNASVAFNRFRLEFGNVTLSLDDINADSLSIYPNPVEDHFQVNMPINSNSSAQIEIYDVLGKRVYSNSFEAVNGKIHVSGFELSQGAYVVKLTTAEGKTYSQKILKK